MFIKQSTVEGNINRTFVLTLDLNIKLGMGIFFLERVISAVIQIYIVIAMYKIPLKKNLSPGGEGQLKAGHLT
ncbi:hypothetical protein NQ317_009529 [Molorchus minor]|uniref:Uncharacterized protein n=1 Tax=Molorchus minor TaxID=1323400 RepID=A0ABQ9IYF5_9CUCU|nr:hypothetical protein NQ317_009529 [Molorchus minor]